MAGIMTPLSLGGSIFIYFPQGMECSNSPWMPGPKTSWGQPRIPKINQTIPDSYKETQVSHWRGDSLPTTSLSHYIMYLFGEGGLGSRWPLGRLLSLSPLPGLLPSYPNHQPFTHNFPKGRYQASQRSLPLCSPMVPPATTMQFSCWVTIGIASLLNYFVRLASTAGSCASVMLLFVCLFIVCFGAPSDY